MTRLPTASVLKLLHSDGPKSVGELVIALGTVEGVDVAETLIVLACSGLIELASSDGGLLRWRPA